KRPQLRLRARRFLARPSAARACARFPNPLRVMIQRVGAALGGRAVPVSFSVETLKTLKGKNAKRWSKLQSQRSYGAWGLSKGGSGSCTSFSVQVQTLHFRPVASGYYGIRKFYFPLRISPLR